MNLGKKHPASFIDNGLFIANYSKPKQKTFLLLFQFINKVTMENVNSKIKIREET